MATRRLQRSPTLAHFVAHALHRTRLHHSVTFTALALLQRLKTRFPAACGSSGHRLSLSAFMIAPKVVCDDTYLNKSWAVVGQGMFALREINQMEREMCAYLEWHLNVPGEDLEKFEKEVRKIYSHALPYSSHTSLSPLSIAASPGPEKAVDREVQQLPTPTDIGLTHTAAPWASSSRASMSSFIQNPSPPPKAGNPLYASKPVHSGYLTPPTSPSTPGTPMSTADSSPASFEASLPTPPLPLPQPNTTSSPRLSPPPPCT
ncbi:hypothetical protein BD410DRAFT_880562 [Rickenella mellea]|uniref:Cyclin N-terminal domain-containing protein n=1 Tax=Rickenella mellea TaxID=50990 RepID=A0A4Y7PT23_9AGAM|nr:hypothetical protein BD410DRAFT_880562 [Rickenella mellea]